MLFSSAISSSISNYEEARLTREIIWIDDVSLLTFLSNPVITQQLMLLFCPLWQPTELTLPGQILFMSHQFTWLKASLKISYSSSLQTPRGELFCLMRPSCLVCLLLQFSAWCSYCWKKILYVNIFWIIFFILGRFFFIPLYQACLSLSGLNCRTFFLGRIIRVHG